MTDPRDDSLDRLLRQTLRQPPDAGATPSCLDAETMAAWIDGGLSGAALAAAEAHAATCTRCRALVAVMVRSETAERHPAEVSSSAPEGLRARNWLPWLVPLAAAALIAMAIWIPRRAQPPAQESTIALAPPAEIAPQVPPSEPIGERQQTPPLQPDGQAAAAKETRPAKAEAARADQSQFRRETAPAPTPPAATPSGRVAPPPSPLPAPAVPPEPPPPAFAPATAVTGAAPVVTPAPNAGAPLAFDRAAAETVLAEFQSPEVLAQSAPIGAAAGRADASASAPAGRGAGAAAGGRGGGAGGRGGGGRGAAPSAALAETVAVPESQPTRWRVLASGIVQRSNPPGAPWESVAIAAGARVTSGSAPSPLVCWLVGRNGLVLLTIDGRSFTRIMFPETADLASVRATSARGATVTTTDGRTFATTDGGQAWNRD